MANTMTNREMAQTISARIGNSPVPFDSVYSISLQIYNELGGEPAQFDSVYSILLEILPLISGGGISSKVIDDNSIVLDKTWSSSKINSEIESLAGSANSEIVTKETVDFKFVNELPVSGEDDELVVIKGDNQDTLYKYVSGEWVEQTPDANILYFDVENEALYSYVTVDRQFAPVSLVNTIVVGSNLNTNAALKAIKTPGVYNVIQKLTNKTKGDYLKNWTLTVESIDYEEYDKSDSIYQKLTNNYTIQKRTWSSTRVANDGWANFSTYYTGEIKDSTTSKYYTWSSNKIAAQIADAGFDVQIVQSLPQSGEAHTIYFVPASESGQSNYYDEFMWVDNAWEKVGSTEVDLSGYYTKVETDALLDAKQNSLTAGQNIDITNDTISADGYVFNDEDGSTALKYRQDQEDGEQIVSNKAVGLGAYAEGYWTIAWGRYGVHAEGNGGLGNIPDVTFTWETDSTTITASSTEHGLRKNHVIYYNGVYSKITNISGSTITLSNTFGEAQTSVSIKKALGVASGSESHSEGLRTVASGDYGSHAEGTVYADGDFGATGDYGSHSEGYETLASGLGGAHAEGTWSIASGSYGAHAEGYFTVASGGSSHAEGKKTVASGVVSHAEGGFVNNDTPGSTASGAASHAEGSSTLASGRGSHAEGTRTVSSAEDTHAEGYRTTASGDCSHAEGYRTTAQNETEHAEGYVNVSHKASDTYGNAGNTQHSVGVNQKNALEIMQNGDAYIKGVGGYDGVHIKSETGYESTQTLQDVISGINTSVSGKQDTLTAGSNITISGNTISATDTTYSDATTSASGLMSAADKTKLNGIEANAEVNVIEGVILSDSVSALTPDANKNVTIPLVSTSSDGLMSAEDKAKLDGYTIATAADILALFAEPTPIQADNEIWYTTESGELWQPYDDYGGGSTLVIDGNTLSSNTYQDGHGVLRYANNITSLDQPWGQTDYNHPSNLISITLPHSINHIGDILHGNSGLNTVNYNGTVAECGKIDMTYFAAYADFDINGKIVCSDGTYDMLG